MCALTHPMTGDKVAAVEQAHTHFGRLDIVVNNAGYGQFGITAFPNVGMYHASKWALEGFSQALAQEVAPFGVHVTLVEPGGFSTDWAGPSAKRAEPLSDYADVHAAAAEERASRNSAPGDPQASARAVLKVVDAPEPPLRVFFGEKPLEPAKADYRSRLKLWEEWQPVAELAQSGAEPT